MMILLIHCTECDFKTNVRTNLTHHVEAVHLKKKRFECTYCDYRFVQKRNLQNHIKRNHEQEPKRSKAVKLSSKVVNSLGQSRKQDVKRVDRKRKLTPKQNRKGSEKKKGS